MCTKTVYQAKVTVRREVWQWRLETTRTKLCSGQRREGLFVRYLTQFILCSADLWSLINDVELVVLDLLHRRLIPTSHVRQYIASSCTGYQLNSSLAKSFHDHGGNIPIRYHIPLINVIPSIPPTFSQSNLIQCWEPPTSFGVREIKHPVAMGCHVAGGIGV